MRHNVLLSFLCLGLVSWAGEALAGGSGRNVAVVVNQNSAGSVQLGNYYCEQRQVPPQNVFRMTQWSGGNLAWSREQFESCLLNPLLSALAARQLTNQIDFVVLSMDIPYQVVDGASVNSTTAVLFYGFKADVAPPDPGLPRSCSLPPTSSNSFAFSEGIFRQSPPDTALTHAFLTMMITASNLSQAKAIVDHGAAADSTFPTQTVYLAKSSDVFRNVRYWLFDDAIFNTRLRGDFAMVRTNQDSLFGLTNLLGYQAGLAQFDLSPDAFRPGALADSLTSFGGMIFAPNGQTTLLAFLGAGAAGSYGTVIEPCNYLEKFPTPHDYFYQARGFSLAEAYYLSLLNPYQGLLIGEPLAAPFAQPASGGWIGLPAGATLAGTTNLSLQFNAADAGHPVQQVDLFLDGTFLQTITNLPPAAGDYLSVTINGHAVNYIVPTLATLRSVTSEFAGQLNANSNVTQVAAYALGDRIELHSLDPSRAGDQIAIAATHSIGTASVLATFLAASRTNFLETIAFGLRGFSVTNSSSVGDYLQLTIRKTNGVQVILAATNADAGTTTYQLTRQLLNAVNGHAQLQAVDGLVAEDLVSYNTSYNEFNLRARTAGWPASQIQVTLESSPTLPTRPAGTRGLDQNLGDLQPRNHLYLTAGVTNLAVTFPLDTALLADGTHQLTAVAYEGSHVRTQKSAAQGVTVQNTPLSASLTRLVSATNTDVETTQQFSVVANTNAISRIELYGTGGLLAATNGQPSALFSIAGTDLGVGLHPFYAVVTDALGRQYRTATQWIRLNPPLRLNITTPPVTISWPATAGRSYDILSTDSLTNDFQVRATLKPTGDTAEWTDTNAASAPRFYRVRTAR